MKNTLATRSSVWTREAKSPGLNIADRPTLPVLFPGKFHRAGILGSSKNPATTTGVNKVDITRLRRISPTNDSEPASVFINAVQIQNLKDVLGGKEF